MAFIYGNKIKVSTFGQLHSDVAGAVIDGLPAGRKIDSEKLYQFLNRRVRGGTVRDRHDFSTHSERPDEPEFLSGLVDGITCGAPLCVTAQNTDPLCIAGGICAQLLEQAGIEIGAHIADIAGIADLPYDPVTVGAETLRTVRKAEFPVLSPQCAVVMREAIRVAQSEGDSLGGIIECAAVGVPAGLCGTIFGGAENKIAGIVFGIPNVCGIEFGNGFVSTLLRGSSNNDEPYMDEDKIKMRSNNHGGILGGVTSGMPIIFRAAIKPPTQLVNLEQNGEKSAAAEISGAYREDVKLHIPNTRHVTCMVSRAVPCIEAAAAIVIFDMLQDVN